MLRAAQSSQGKAVLGRFGNGSTSGAAMFLTLAAVGGLIDQNGRTDGGVVPKPSPRCRNWA
jgi:hypothetical protein